MVVADIHCVPPVLLEPFLDTTDFLMFLTVSNPDNRYIVVEALAGCGKTAMLTNLVKRVNQKNAVLLLSFTQQAITIARVRTDNGIHVQTFDSLFYQTVKHGVGHTPITDSYEVFRNISETLTEKHLQDFVGRTHDRYAMNDIQYIMVDEAQDTPPQAYQLLETFRTMGKTIVITGDRHQAIFTFMATQSLFDMIPPIQKHVHYLKKTRRCCPQVVAFLNVRFGLNMESAYPSALGPDVIDAVCVQTQHNATLGRLFAKFLFTMDTVLTPQISDGESSQRFWDAVYLECSRMYAVDPTKAKVIVDHRQHLLSQKHRFWSQTPRQWRLPMFIFATVHHFKGGECDVTILGDDVDMHTRTDDPSEERMKYVAASRSRWGIVDLHTFGFHGHVTAQALLYRGFLKCREKVGVGGLAPRISAVSDMPACIVPLILSPVLQKFVQALRRLQTTASFSLSPPPKLLSKTAMKVGSVMSVIVAWVVERNARTAHVPVHVSNTGMSLKITLDRKYSEMKRLGQIDPVVDAELRRILARLKIQVALARYLVVFHHWPPSSLMVRRAALAQAQLQSFALCCSVLTMERKTLDLVTNIRVVQMLDEIETRNFPGILGDSDMWWSVNLRQAVMPNPHFYLRGMYDIVIVTKDKQCHVVHVRTVRTIGPSLVLQTLLYRTVMASTLGMIPRGKSFVYEANRNELCALDTEVALEMSMDDEGRLLGELEHVLFAKIIPQYYPSTLSIDAIVALL